MQLAGKVTLVTGGASGIGRAVCLGAAALGADVMVLDLNAAGAEGVAAEVRGLGRRAAALAADVTDSQAVLAAVNKGMADVGPVDTLMSCAGWDRMVPFVQTDEEFWRKIVNINLMGPIVCTRVVLGTMIERRQGSLVYVASDAGRVGSSGEAVYAAAKAGVIAFAKTMAREQARYGIRANAVCPGLTDTPLLQAVREGSETSARILDAITQATPLRRVGRPEEIAAAILFLASDEASYITGQTLSVSGGLTMA